MLSVGWLKNKQLHRAIDDRIHDLKELATNRSDNVDPIFELSYHRFPYLQNNV
jgi:hypothetical protein